MTTSSRAAPGPPRRRLVGRAWRGPGAGRGGAARRAGPTGGRSGRSAVPKLHNNKRNETGRRRPVARPQEGWTGPAPRAPRPPSGSRSYLSRPAPPAHRFPPVPAKPGTRCLRRPSGCWSGPRKCGRGRRPGPLAPGRPAALPDPRALPSGRPASRGQCAPCLRCLCSLRSPLRAGRPPARQTLVGPGVRAEAAPGHGPAKPRRGAAVGCSVSASSPECGLFSWPRRDLLLSLLLLTPLHSSSCPPPLDCSCPLRTRRRSPRLRRSERGRRPGTHPPQARGAAAAPPAALPAQGRARQRSGSVTRRPAPAECPPVPCMFLDPARSSTSLFEVARVERAVSLPIRIKTLIVLITRADWVLLMCHILCEDFTCVISN